MRGIVRSVPRFFCVSGPAGCPARQVGYLPARFHCSKPAPKKHGDGDTCGRRASSTGRYFFPPKKKHVRGGAKRMSGGSLEGKEPTGASKK
ncbi:MAG: hypothetical protein D6714_14490 [Bacteroidetes bacterium]|nr:MAG: hypothetical protein D6714_14490 [Bacteroidota bacterium]